MRGDRLGKGIGRPKVNRGRGEGVGRALYFPKGLAMWDTKWLKTTQAGHVARVQVSTFLI